MSEYKGKKSSTAKSYKKPFDKTKEKTSKFAGSKKAKDYTVDSDDAESGQKKRFNKTKSTDRPYKSVKKATDLVPRIKKRFSEFEKGSDQKEYDKKPKKSFSKSKQSYSDNKDDESKYKSSKTSGSKDSDRETKKPYSKSKRSYSDSKDNDSKYKSSKTSGSKDSDRETKKPYSKSKRSYSDSKDEESKYKSSKTSGIKDSDRETKKPYSKSKRSYSDSKDEESKYKSSKTSGIKDSDKETKKPYSKSKRSYSDSKDEESKYKSSKTSNYKGNKSYDKDQDHLSKPRQKTYTRVPKKRMGSKKNDESNDFEGTVRLNRYIAASGICSRREADELISLGEVKVNGTVVTEMGTKVNPTDKVEVGGQSITPEKKVYILLNKPKDFVSTVSDPHADKTVMDLVKLSGNQRIYPVGRLDKNTTGVMLLTNDGDLTKKLTHPSYNKKKIYHVVLDKPATKANLQQIIDGFELEDGLINADAISFVNEGDKTEIGIEIHSGRNRIVRRIFEHLGFEVIRLDRVYFAGLTKQNVPRGKWRYLSEKEVNILKQGSYE